MTKDLGLNTEWLTKQFEKVTTVVNADPEKRLDGWLRRDLRQDWLADLLIATGHRVNRKTGEVTYIRNVSDTNE